MPTHKFFTQNLICKDVIFWFYLFYSCYFYSIDVCLEKNTIEVCSLSGHGVLDSQNTTYFWCQFYSEGPGNHDNCKDLEPRLCLVYFLMSFI